jgi:fructose-1,6-bisphosphatase
LRLWPTDEQILQTIKHSRHLACELSEFLKMIQPADITIKRNLHISIGVHEKEVSNSKNQNQNNEEQNENIESDLIAVLTEASQEMKRISTEECDEEDLLIFFKERSSQLNKINQVSENLSVLYNGHWSK